MLYKNVDLFTRGSQQELVLFKDFFKLDAAEFGINNNKLGVFKLIFLKTFPSQIVFKNTVEVAIEIC